MKSTDNSTNVSKRQIKKMKKNFINGINILIFILFFILLVIVAYGLFVIISQFITGEFLN